MTALEPLSTTECWTVLGHQDVGRVAFTENAMPTIVPLAYAVTEERLLLRCPTERMAGQLEGQVVAFQVDDSGEGERRSVVVTGTVARQRGSDGLRGDAGTDVRLDVGSVRGHRLRRAA